MLRKELIVTVRRRDGRVETRRVVVGEKVGEKEGGDLVTLWAFRLLCCIFASGSMGDTRSFDFVDLDGVSRSQKCIGPALLMFFGTGCGIRAPFIGFGSSSVPPTRTDYRLLGEYERVRGFTTADETTFTCNIGGSWTPDSGVTVCEVGLYMFVCDFDGVSRYLLFDRSVLDPCVSVGAGDTITATYTFGF